LLYGLYQLLGWLTLIIGFPFFLVYSLITGRYRRGLAQRFGFLGLKDNWPPGKKVIWLHGASVGEVLLARNLIKKLALILPDADFVLSTVTEQGMEIAGKAAEEKIHCIYAPLDLKGIVNLSISHIRPLLYICLETELWPSIVFETRRAGVRLMLLNGRMSEQSYRRYKLIKRLMAGIISCFAMIAVIQESDARRYIGLGADPEKVRVLGNAKYDQETAGQALEDEKAHRAA